MYQAEVDFYEEDVSIQFTNADGAISGGKLDDLNWTERNRDVWSYNYTATEGSEIYLSGIQTSSFGEVIIRLYVDGVLQQTAVSSSGVRATINHTL